MLIRLHELMDGAQAARLVATLTPGATPGQAEVTSETALARGRDMAAALVGNAAVEAAAMPRHITDFAITRLSQGMAHERPIDATVIRARDRDPLRVDLIMTLFLSAPETYDGGELVVVADSGTQRIKLAAGDAAIYPATNYHRVETVTGGERWTAEAAIQSTIRDDEERKILGELGTVLDWMGAAPPEAAEHLATSRRALRRARANLVRMWLDV